MADVSGPLAGVRVVEFAGIGPCPYAGMVLADLGADVVRVDRDVRGAHSQRSVDLLQRGKRSVAVDLKRPEGVGFALELVIAADIAIEGFRPGVMERLGLGPEVCLARSPALVYGRMTGWGQDGPLAPRAGHDIDYIALSGALGSIGRAGERPVPPLNLVGDFGGGGLLLSFGLLAALLSSRGSGRGQVVDAAMVDGASLLMTLFYGLRAEGHWEDTRGTNLLDTGAPFYDVYECADGGMIAVGALEREFYDELLDVIGLEQDMLPPRMERATWPDTKVRMAAIFMQRPRDEWLALAEGRDACLAPVLSLSEAPVHPHSVARGSFVEVDGITQPAPAPRFSATPCGVPTPPCVPGGGGRAALADWGVSTENLERLTAAGVVAVQ